LSTEWASTIYRFFAGNIDKKMAKKKRWLLALILIAVIVLFQLMGPERLAQIRSGSGELGSNLQLRNGDEHENGNPEHAEMRQTRNNDAKSASRRVPIHNHIVGAQMTTTGTRPWCSNKQIVRGHWLPTTLERPPYIPMSPRVRCLPPNAFDKPFKTYMWEIKSQQDDQNHHCQFAALDKSLLCEMLCNQTLAFVGDSLTLEHYASLVHLLGDRARLPPKAVQHGRIRRRICAPNKNGIGGNKEIPDENGCCFDLIFKTDFFLLNITAEIQQSMPTVLVVNRGAHFKPDDELLDSLRAQTFPALLDWNEKCKSIHLSTKCILIWRTTVPGHPHCEKFTEPSTSVADMEEWIHEKSTKDPTVYRKGEYHWQDFQRQNRLVADQVWQAEWKSQLTHIHMEWMDSYATNILRPDNHRSHMGDCLHSCSPGGGSDLNSQWLYHILRKHYHDSSSPAPQENMKQEERA